MNRTTFNISMPESMRKFVNSRAGSGRYGSASEYIRELIRKDQNRLQRNAQLKSQRSGPGFASAPFIRHDDLDG